MSKKNHNNHHDREMKQLIRDHQRDIAYYQRKNGELHDHIKTMQLGNQDRFIRMLGCVYLHCLHEQITEEQAGGLMLSLVGEWYNT